MAEIVDEFRAQLSQELRLAMAKRNSEDVSTIRSLMSALDNASALSKEEISKLPDTSMTEVSRKKLSKEDIKAILQSEIETRMNARIDYEKIGNKHHAALVEQSIATIQRLSAILN